MISKEELFAKYDIEEISEMFRWVENIDGWKVVSQEMTDYDEGSVYTEIVFQHEETGRYFSHTNVSNSWVGDDEPFDMKNVIEVEPKEVKVIKYFPIQI